MKSTSAINLRVLAAVSLFASKDEARSALMGVCLEIDARTITYVSTDGVRLLAYREELDAEDKDNLLTGEFIIPTRHCKVFKFGKEEEGRGRIFGTGRLTLAYNFIDFTFEPIEAPYPDWRKIIPRTCASGVPAQYSLKHASDLAKFCKALDLIPFIAANGQGPAPIWFANRPDVMGLIMPMKALDDIGRRAENWALRGGPKKAQGDIEDEPLFPDEPYDPETGEILAEDDGDDSELAEKVAASPAVRRAVKGLGTPVELTEEERAKGFTAAFVKNGNRMTIGTGSVNP